MTKMTANFDRASILEDLREIFVEKFEVDKDSVSLEAKLYDDLDIDSIDAVDLMVALKKRTGKKLDPEVFKQVRTVGDIVEAVHSLMNEK
jgi:acyl carrier protein